jgi:D-amino-acid dehydrogenase
LTGSNEAQAVTRLPGTHRPPARVLVVGAGIVGLSCAWSLQDHGTEVYVADKASPGAGSSWANAGYVSPSLCVPLPEPSILRYGLRAVLSPRSPVRLAPAADPELARFMLGLVRHCTTASWQHGMAAYRALNEGIVGAYQQQLEAGVDASLLSCDILSCFERAGDSGGLLHELASVIEAGQQMNVELLTGDQARETEPHVSSRVAMAVRIRAQQYLTPSRYVTALADSVRRRGGKILEETAVTAVERRSGVLVARSPAGDLEAEAVILANGAWMSSLAAAHGVKVPVHAGRGYSFTLPCSEPLRGPLHLPFARLAVTPQGDRVRIAGIMEFASPDAPLNKARIKAMLQAVRPFLDGVDWDGRRDEWVGARPLTADGVPLVGETRTTGVFVAGGHGMWGVTLGPLTGRLLAEQIATGVTPPVLRPLDPCR